MLVGFNSTLRSFEYIRILSIRDSRKIHVNLSKAESDKFVAHKRRILTS